MDYYGNNDWRDYLAHHGILGMKWGRRNGPPYPLDGADHSASEKKAGWRKSLGGGVGEAIRLHRKAKKLGVSMNDVARKEKAEQHEKSKKPKKEKKLSPRQKRDAYEMAIRNDNGDIDYKKFLDNSNFEFIMLDKEAKERIKASINNMNEEYRRDGTNEKYRKMKMNSR